MKLDNTEKGWFNIPTGKNEVITTFNYDSEDSTIVITTEIRDLNTIILTNPPTVPQFLIKEYTFASVKNKIEKIGEKTGKLVTFPSETIIEWEN